MPGIGFPSFKGQWLGKCPGAAKRKGITVAKAGIVRRRIIITVNYTHFFHVGLDIAEQRDINAKIRIGKIGLRTILGIKYVLLDLQIAENA